MVLQWYFGGVCKYTIEWYLNGTSMALGVLWTRVSEWYFNGTLVVCVNKQLNGI